MGISDLMELFSKYGIKGSVGILGIFLLYTIIKTKWFSGVLSNLSDKFIEYFMKRKTTAAPMKVITESDILNHDIFNYIDFWMYSKIPTFQFSTEYRTAVFRRYLIIFLKEHKSILSESITSKEYQLMDDSALWKQFLSAMNKIVFSYEKEMEVSGIPKIIIDKMKVKNNDTITLTIDLIEGICNSQFYTSDKNLLKVYSILNIMLSVLESTISNSEGVCNSINGSLKGLEFNGFKEP